MAMQLSLETSRPCVMLQDSGKEVVAWDELHESHQDGYTPSCFKSRAVDRTPPEQDINKTEQTTRIAQEESSSPAFMGHLGHR